VVGVGHGHAARFTAGLRQAQVRGGAPGETLFALLRLGNVVEADAQAAPTYPVEQVRHGLVWAGPEKVVGERGVDESVGQRNIPEGIFAEHRRTGGGSE